MIIPKLSILMCSLNQRPDLQERQIAKQLDIKNACFTNLTINNIECTLTCFSNSSIEFLILKDNGQLTSGEKRQNLLNKSIGKYICFVDDDDFVCDDYVTKLLEGCNSNADVITFNLNYFINNEYVSTWKFGLHPNYKKIGLMCVNHLCAWKESLAKQVAWCTDLGYGDDRLWFEPLYYSKRIRNNFHINSCLYNYTYSPSTTVNQNKNNKDFSGNYFYRGIRCFIKNSKIYIEVPDNNQDEMDKRIITVRDNNNSITFLDTELFTPFHIVKG